MEKIDTHMSLVIQSAWAESTLNTRNSQWGKFLNFCRSNRLVPLPASVNTVCRFLIHIASTCAYNTCNNYLSAIVVLHRFMGFSGSFREVYVVQLVLKGLARILGKNVSQKIGLSPDQFVSMYNNLSLSDVNNITMWSAVMLSFRSLLRKSNIVQTNLKDCGSVIQRSDVISNENGLILNVRRTKTLQSKEYVLQIPINYVDSPIFCAVSMLDTHFARTRHITDGPLFWKLDKSGTWRPLLYKDLLSFLKTCVQSIGLDPGEVGLHSLRRSGAAYMHTLGISFIDIMNAGDWKSLAALAYLISPLSRKEQIESEVSSALSKFV